VAHSGRPRALGSLANVFLEVAAVGKRDGGSPPRSESRSRGAAEVSQSGLESETAVSNLLTAGRVCRSEEAREAIRHFSPIFAHSTAHIDVANSESPAADPRDHG